MSYNPNIPIGTDPMLKSQGQIKANYQAINAAFVENHVGLTLDEKFSGMHNVLLLREQTGDPTTSATQLSLYSKAVNSITELFFRPSNSQTAIQITYPTLRTGLQSENPDVFFPTQYTFIAGPFIIYGGLLTGVTSGQVVTLLPASTLLYVSLILTNIKDPGKANFSAAATAVAANQFTVEFQTPGVTTPDMYYFAIGQP